MKLCRFWFNGFTRKPSNNTLFESTSAKLVKLNLTQEAPESSDIYEGRYLMFHSITLFLTKKIRPCEEVMVKLLLGLLSA